MKNIITNIISEEIDLALKILKRKKLLEQESNPIDQALGAQLSQEENPIVPQTEPMGDELSPTEDETETEGETEDEAEGELDEQDPVEASFDELKQIAIETDNVVELISAIKSIAQDTFSTPDAPDPDKPDIKELIDKILSSTEKDVNLLKKALKRPELQFLQSDAVINLGEVNKDED